MAHSIENTGDIDCISFKTFRLSRLTHGCLESLQSEAKLANRRHQPPGPRLCEFRAARRFPAAVRGPVDFRELRWLAAIRAGLETGFPLSSAITNSITTSIPMSSLFFEAS